MKTEKPYIETSYLPISWDDTEVIKEAIENKNAGKIFFFGRDGLIDEVKGCVVQIAEEKGKGVYAVMDSGDRVRVDRIITIFGKVGAAYDEYEVVGNACMACR